MITISKLPILKSIAALENNEFKNVFKNKNIEERVRESQYCLDPKKNRNKEISGTILLKPNALKNSNELKTEEELTLMDDNEIIEELTNFTGVMQLWYSMSLNERLVNLLCDN